MTSRACWALAFLVYAAAALGAPAWPEMVNPCVLAGALLIGVGEAARARGR